jgi:hypothetical protein
MSTARAPNGRLSTLRYAVDIAPAGGLAGPVHLLHVDGDLYSSAVTVLEHVGPRLVPGSVVVFDEFFNFPGWEQHEFRAWQEHLQRTGARVASEAHTSNAEQVVARVLDAGTAAGGPTVRVTVAVGRRGA